jgi:hypothetical protein
MSLRAAVAELDSTIRLFVHNQAEFEVCPALLRTGPVLTMRATPFQRVSKLDAAAAAAPPLATVTQSLEKREVGECRPQVPLVLMV